MANKTKTLEPSFIYNLFDSIIAKIDFFKLPRFETFLHSFRVLEAWESEIFLGSESFDSMLSSSRFFQDTKKYLIYWIYTICPKQGRFILTNESDIEKSMLAISLASNFSYIHDAIVAVQKGWADFHFDEKKKLIEFKYRNPEKGLLFYSKFNDRVIWERKNIITLSQRTEDHDVLDEAFRQFSDTVHITKDMELRYSINEFILYAFEEITKESLAPQYMLKDSWVLGAYSISDFRSIWIQLSKLSVVHMLAFIDSYRKFGKYDSGFNNSIFRIRKNTLLNYLKKHTKLSDKVISEIIRDLTYDYSVTHMDIMYQPLIEMNGEIFISPNLLLGSFIDRNLQVLLTKLPYRKNEVEILKNFKEDKMIEDLSPQLKKAGFKFKPKITLKENKKKKTDIDLLIWDDTYKNFLVVQLKWFYGPDSTQELFNHDVQFSEGIFKTKICLEYLNKNIEKVTSVLKIPYTKGNKNIVGIILSKLSTPSPFISDPNFPVIEELDFAELLENCNGNALFLYKKIVSFLKSKKNVSGLKMSSSKISLEGYTFNLPAIEY